MTKYNVRIDEKITTWRYNYFTLEANDKEEAKKIISKSINDFSYCLNGEDFLDIGFDVIEFVESKIEANCDENMSVSENHNNAIIKVALDDKYLWDNKNKFEF